MDYLDLKKKIIISLIFIVCLFSLSYWIYGKLYVSTDDAYVGADVVQISPQVTGKVKNLYVSNNQYVTAGELLFDLETEIYDAALLEAQAGLLVSEAKLKIAQLTKDRTIELARQKAASYQENDIAIGNLEAAIAQRNINQALVTKAELNLQYTKIRAYTSGWIANMTLQVGDSVTSHQPLFALVSDKKFWIDANFKETELEHVRVGQKVDIKIDMYPNQDFYGVVESFSSGTGNAFSLLPPENATGNWVKITQRVPVRILIINNDFHQPLRIGTSALVTIHTSLLSRRAKNINEHK